MGKQMHYGKNCPESAFNITRSGHYALASETVFDCTGGVVLHKNESRAVNTFQATRFNRVQNLIQQPPTVPRQHQQCKSRKPEIAWKTFLSANSEYRDQMLSCVVP